MTQTKAATQEAAAPTKPKRPRRPKLTPEAQDKLRNRGQEVEVNLDPSKSVGTLDDEYKAGLATDRAGNHIITYNNGFEAGKEAGYSRGYSHGRAEVEQEVAFERQRVAISAASDTLLRRWIAGCTFVVGVVIGLVVGIGLV